MADYGHELTDKELAKLERKIKRVYGEAKKDLDKTVKDYFKRFERLDDEKKQKVADGEMTEEEYKTWRLNAMGRGERYEAMRDKVAKRMTDANVVARAYVEDKTPGIYSLNRNFAAYTIEQAGAQVDFTLFDESTVRRLVMEDPDIMPYYSPAKALDRGIDLKWGKKQITKSITSSILQGKSITKIADDLQGRIVDMNRASSIRAARTAVTSAENAGRMDSYKAAEGMGIKVRKQWLATLDGRTRHEHRVLDGQTRDVDKPFNVDGYEIMYPGDPSAEGFLVYNCRCTLIADIPKYGAKGAQRRARDEATGKNVVIEDMTYSEWAERKKSVQSHTQYKIATTREEAYDIITGIGFSEVSNSIQHIDDKTVIALANQLKALNNKFKVIQKGHAGYVSAENSKKFIATTRGSFTSPENQSLVFSFDSYAKGLNHLTKETQKSVLSGWSMPCLPENYAVYTVTHEYGHVLENFLIHDMVDFDVLSEKLSKVGTNVSKFAKIRQDEAKKHAQSIFREIIDIAKEDNPDFSLKKQISDYGKTDYFEAFAETFANSQLGEPNELGKAMQKWLKRRGYSE